MEQFLTVRTAPELNLEIIKRYICPRATDQEAFTFLQLCKAQGLNPFLREAYLIKYGDENATIVVGKDTFTKRADRIPQYDGFKAGIIILSNDKVLYREGSFLVTGETLLGGWAEVFRKDRSTPFRNEVSLTEYERRKKDGSLMSSWRTMPATMIRKVPLVQSLREAFPDEFGGMYSPEEMPIDASALPIYNYGERSEVPAPREDKKPPLTQPEKKSDKQGPKTADDNKISEAQRKRFYAIYKNAGKTDDEVKEYLFMNYDIEHSVDIPKDKYEEIVNWAEEERERQPGEDKE